MRTALLGSCVLAAFALTACEHRPRSPQPLIAALPPSPAVNMSGPSERNMANCPCAVAGATTRLSFADQAIALTIEGPPEAVGLIRRLAAYQVEIHGARRDGRHTGRGTGAGGMGYCPIVHLGTDLELAEIESGVRLTIRAREASQVKRLRVVIASRLQVVRTRALQALIDQPSRRARIAEPADSTAQRALAPVSPP